MFFYIWNILTKRKAVLYNVEKFTMNFTRNKNMFLCQSCAGKIKKEKDFGTEKDGTRSKVYCRYCYKNGKWRLFLLR